MMNIVFQYPLWYLLLCIISGGFYALLLYYKDRHIDDFSKTKIYLLATIRFLAVFFITLLLLNPLIKYKKIEKEHPVIIFAQDNSKSVRINKDSTFYDDSYPKLINQLITSLEEKYEIKTLTFSSKVKDTLLFTFDDEITDFSSLEKYLYDSYLGQNIGAVILATDGIYTRGKNPKYLLQKIQAPVYTLALGDSTPQKDVVIQEIDVNNIVFSGNDFPVYIYLSAKLSKGDNSIVKISSGGKTLFSQKIRFQSDEDFIPVKAVLNAGKQKGTVKYTVSVAPVDGEISVKNNYQNFYIDVIDNKTKILLLADAPHPDLGTLKRLLEQNINYETEIQFIEDFKKNIDAYHVVVLHNLPSKKHRAGKLFNHLSKSQVSYLQIIGNNTSIKFTNQYDLPWKIQDGLQHKKTQFQAEKNENFGLFEIEKADRIHQFPPLSSVFGKVVPKKTLEIALFQKISNVSTGYPMLGLTSDGASDRKAAFFVGENFWRWSFSEYAMYDNQEAFKKLFSKVIQYLALKEDKSRFKVITEKQYYETDKIIIKAELFDKIYQPVKNATINMVITGENQTEYTYVIPPFRNYYKLIINGLPEGEYSYSAYTVTDGEKLEKQGKFTVLPVDVEALNTQADFSSLRQLSEKHNGKLFYPLQIHRLIDELSANNQIKPIVYETETLEDLIHKKWIFFLIVLLLSVEWWVRKYSGAY